MSHVLAVTDELGELLGQSCVVVNRSTVPVGTAERVAQRTNSRLSKRGKCFAVTLASNPEFLKEGSAIDNFMRPDRVIVGCDEPKLERSDTVEDPLRLHSDMQ